MKQAQKKGKNNDTAREKIIGVFREILSDPELDLPLTRSANSRLKKSSADKEKGAYKDLSEVL